MIEYDDNSDMSSSLDIVSWKDEKAMVATLIAKNLGQLPTEDEIPPGAILNEEEKGAGAGPHHRHVFKKTEEYFY